MCGVKVIALRFLVSQFFIIIVAYLFHVYFIVFLSFLFINVANDSF